MAPALTAAAAACGSCGAAVTLGTSTLALNGSSSSSGFSSGSGSGSGSEARCGLPSAAAARLQISSQDVGFMTRSSRRSGLAAARAAAKSGDDKEGGQAESNEKKKKKSEGGEAKEKKGDKASFFTSITDALDFAQARSEKDAELIASARETTKSGQQMSKEQYGALRRKIGGTYQDFFKEYVEVAGDYVDAGWVDKTCQFCKQDTSKEPRTKDSRGRYAHVACMEENKQKPSGGNFFSKLFGRG